VKLHYALPAGDAYRSERERHPLCVAVGVFDGYHLGHQAIVRTLLHNRRAGERSAVITFAEHPTAYLRPADVPPQIATMGERVNAFARAGVDEMFILTFDEHIAALSPEAFLDDVLVGQLGVRLMVVGETFRFGAKRVGDVAFAKAHFAAQGREAIGVPNATVDGERVSSTRIRKAIAAGDLVLADRLLGVPYMVRGTVVFGAGRGHDLGFPTANVAVPPEKMLPPDGVYAITGRHDGHDHPGLVSIGTNPTFAGTARTVEAWLLDFRGSLYGEELVLRDFRFVRPQQKFDSVDALLAQMAQDATAVSFPSFT
jgi:riboflavin kinase / FMN adenylyltransferase